MTTLSASEFKSIFTDFASTSDDLINFELTCIEEHVDETLFGDCYKNAAYYLLAHSLTLISRGSGSSGPITSESVGSLSRSYGSNTFSSASSLASTSYGTKYLSLVRQYASGPSIV